MRRKRIVYDQPVLVASTNIAEEASISASQYQSTYKEFHGCDYVPPVVSDDKPVIRITREHMAYFNKYGHMPFVMNGKNIDRLNNALFCLTASNEEDILRANRLRKNRKQSMKIAHKQGRRYFL